MRRSRGGPPGKDPMEHHKATCTKTAFNVGPPSARQRNSFEWRFAGAPMIGPTLNAGLVAL